MARARACARASAGRRQLRQPLLGCLRAEHRRVEQPLQLLRLAPRLLGLRAARWRRHCHGRRQRRRRRRRRVLRRCRRRLCLGRRRGRPLQPMELLCHRRHAGLQRSLHRGTLRGTLRGARRAHRHIRRRLRRVHQVDQQRLLLLHVRRRRRAASLALEHSQLEGRDRLLELRLPLRGGEQLRRHLLGRRVGQLALHALRLLALLRLRLELCTLHLGCGRGRLPRRRLLCLCRRERRLEVTHLGLQLVERSHALRPSLSRRRRRRLCLCRSRFLAVVLAVLAVLVLLALFALLFLPFFLPFFLLALIARRLSQLLGQVGLELLALFLHFVSELACLLLELIGRFLRLGLELLRRRERLGFHLLGGGPCFGEHGCGDEHAAPGDGRDRPSRSLGVFTTGSLSTTTARYENGLVRCVRRQLAPRDRTIGQSAISFAARRKNPELQSEIHTHTHHPRAHKRQRARSVQRETCTCRVQYRLRSPPYPRRSP